MDKEVVKNHHHHNSTTTSRGERHHHNHHHPNNNINNNNTAAAGGATGGNSNTNNLINSSRSQSDTLRSPQSSDLLLRWGNRKRLRCMKIQVKDEPFSKTTVRVDRRVVRGGETNNNNNNGNSNNHIMNHGGGSHQSNNGGHFNLRQRPASPAHLPVPTTQRVLRNSESTMKGHGNGGVRGISSPDRAQDHNNNNNNYIKRGGSIYNHHGHDSNGRNGSVEPACQDNNNKKGGSSSGSDGMPTVWPPKFVIALTNKEKEEDFMAIKGSKLPLRPKKRAKVIQRTLNLVSPGGWLCDLTLERYEVREKKVSKKRPRGLKAMGNMDSDSE